MCIRDSCITAGHSINNTDDKRVYFNRCFSSTPISIGCLLYTSGDVHDIGKNIVAVVMACNGYDIVDLGVMVPAETIVQRAISSKEGVMAHVALELEKAGLDIPLLIGGATISKMHTALKIAPVYHAPVVHLKDASQNASVASKLLNPQPVSYTHLTENKKSP